jgi:hypothetical protein
MVKRGQKEGSKYQGQHQELQTPDSKNSKTPKLQNSKTPKLQILIPRDHQVGIKMGQSVCDQSSKCQLNFAPEPGSFVRRRGWIQIEEWLSKLKPKIRGKSVTAPKYPSFPS